MTTTDLLNKYNPLFTDALQDARTCADDAKANYDAKKDATAKVQDELNQLLAVMNAKLPNFSNCARMIRSLVNKVNKTVEDLDQATEAVVAYRDALQEKPAVEERLSAAKQEEAKAKEEWEKALNLFNAISKWTSPLDG